MSQIQPVPGPSQDAFNALSEQIGTLSEKFTWSKVDGTSTHSDGSDARIYPSTANELFIVEGTGYNEAFTVPVTAIPSGDSYWYTKTCAFHIVSSTRKVWCYNKNGATTGMVVSLYYR